MAEARTASSLEVLRASVRCSPQQLSLLVLMLVITSQPSSTVAIRSAHRYLCMKVERVLGVCDLDVLIYV